MDVPLRTKLARHERRALMITLYTNPFLTKVKGFKFLYII
jgi:hypothetical protein